MDWRKQLFCVTDLKCRKPSHNNGLLHFRFEEGQGGTSMESLVLKPDKLDINYDEKSDVLYI